MNAVAPAAETAALKELCAGFTDATHQSQRVFRRVLAAMAEPGTVHNVAQQPAPAPLSAAAYQVCLALLDQDTPLWLQPDIASIAAINSLRFHCGCGMAAGLGEAVFALVTASSDTPLARFNPGSVEYPDRSTTVIVEVSSLADDGDLRLQGPGIRGKRHVQIGGLDERWLQQLADNHRAFPCGVDLILTCENRLMALPRTTRVSLNGQES